MTSRLEHDAMGEVAVPADRLWGAQTQRSVENFPIGVGHETMPDEIITAFGILKLAAARANRTLLPGKMTEEKFAVIGRAAEEVRSGALAGHFPLVVWQTGSGTQTNMNVNEVIANRANALAGKALCHPNDDVNMSQSSNDTFPTALHIAAVLALEEALIPAVEELKEALCVLERENAGIVKSGRTHLQDAVPIAFSQEISGWRASLERDLELLRLAVRPLYGLALGGTAVGIAASQGNFELNVFLPVIAYNFLQSVRLLAESVRAFTDRCVRGIRANRERMKGNLDASLMTVTALSPTIGYENAAKCAKLAFDEDLTLKEACLKLGLLTPERFDALYRPEEMI